MADQPNLFSLTGDGVSVTLALNGLDGKPQLTYHDSVRAQNFSGDEITFEDNAGLVSTATVTIVRSVDVGFTSFTLLLPVINEHAPGPQPVRTLGITTLHATSLARIGRPQLTDYHVLQLHGTASAVQSLTGAAPASI
jgi:hypothetical protein